MRLLFHARPSVDFQAIKMKFLGEDGGEGGGGCDSVVYTTAMFFSFCGHRI